MLILGFHSSNILFIACSIINRCYSFLANHLICVLALIFQFSSYGCNLCLYNGGYEELCRSAETNDWHSTFDWVRERWFWGSNGGAHHPPKTCECGGSMLCPQFGCVGGSVILCVLQSLINNVTLLVFAIAIYIFVYFPPFSKNPELVWNLNLIGSISNLIFFLKNCYHRTSFPS